MVSVSVPTLTFSSDRLWPERFKIKINLLPCKMLLVLVFTRATESKQEHLDYLNPRCKVWSPLEAHRHSHAVTGRVTGIILQLSSSYSPDRPPNMERKGAADGRDAADQGHSDSSPGRVYFSPRSPSSCFFPPEDSKDRCPFCFPAEEQTEPLKCNDF